MGSGQVFLGIEIGGTKLQIVAGDETGKIMKRWRAGADRDRGGQAIQKQICEGLDEIRSGIEPAAIGVGFGGPVDWKTGRICRSHQVDGWENFPLRDWLAEQSRLPVAVE